MKHPSLICLYKVRILLSIGQAIPSFADNAHWTYLFVWFVDSRTMGGIRWLASHSFIRLIRCLANDSWPQIQRATLFAKKGSSLVYGRDSLGRWRQRQIKLHNVGDPTYPILSSADRRRRCSRRHHRCCSLRRRYRLRRLQFKLHYVSTIVQGWKTHEVSAGWSV